MSMRIDPQASLRYFQIRKADDAKHQAHKAAGDSPAAPPAMSQENVRPAGGPTDLETALRNLEAQNSDLQAVAHRLQEAQRDPAWVAPDGDRERPGVADPDEARQTAETLRRAIEAQAQIAARVQVRGLAGAAVNLLA